MVRRYEESIEVRAGEGVGQCDIQCVDIQRVDTDRVDTDRGDINRGAIDPVRDLSPSAFLWRGRLYVVRDVIGHWRERRPWWRDALDPDEDVAAHGLGCLEQEVWRVEASPGRLAGTGVYDLGKDGKDGDLGNLGTDGPGRGWRLLRVAD